MDFNSKAKPACHANEEIHTYADIDSLIQGHLVYA